MYNVSTSVVIRTYWEYFVPRAFGPLDNIPQYVRITTDVLYQYIRFILCIMVDMLESVQDLKFSLGFQAKLQL